MGAKPTYYRGRQAAWHVIGTVTGQYSSSSELLADPGFQYRVFKSQLRDGLGRPVDAWGTFRWDAKDELAGDKAAARFLAAVGKDYCIIPKEEGIQTVDELMGQVDGAFYETAGVLADGATFWALADLKLRMRIGDDEHKSYLMFSTGFDGRKSFNFRLVDKRVICDNTFDIAMSEKTTASLTIRHTKNALARLKDARAAVVSLGDDVRRMEDRLNFLAGRKLNRESIESIFNRLFPKRKKEDTDGQTVAVDTTRRNNILADIMKLDEVNDGNAFPEQRGTAYNLLNAITEYTDHERSSKDDGRAVSALFGSGSDLKSRAVEVIYEASKGLEEVRRGPSVSVDFAELGLNVPGVN